MIDPDWKRVEALFNEASELDTQRRVAFLERECADRPDLRQRVETLVRISREDDDTLSNAIEEAAREMDQGDTALVGMRLGAYEVVAPLGRGGMGSVFEARRADGTFEARVAIKILRGALAGGDVLRRFKAERKILGALDHPNIARLLDAGRTPDGLPYMVMELVDGVPLDEYCDRERLTIDERVQLFEQVCEAVQVAHRSFIVHRDIKPANILVSDDGVPKLLDFGIAKLLEAPGLVETLLYTATGVDVMTPAYASPEQIRGEAITAATDVYGLGLVLYELLTGVKAQRFRDRTALEVDRVICRDLPTGPAATYRTIEGDEAAGTSVAARASARRSTPVHVRRTLGGDLGTIVMKALRKEPERRYGSVEAFSGDLRRYRRGLPVNAQPDSLTYRARRFVGRHPVGTGATTLTALLIIGFSSLLAVQNVRIADERDAAERRRQVAAEVSDFLVSVFGTTDPTGGEGVLPAEVLAEGRLRVAALSERPAVQAGVTAAMGRLYHELGMFDEALAALGSAYAQQVDLFGPESGEVAASLQMLGDVRLDMGDVGEASRHYRDALDIQDALVTRDHPERIASLVGLAKSVREEGRDRESDSLFVEARAAYGDARSLTTATLRFEHAEVLFQAARVEEALTAARTAAALREAQLPPGHVAIEESLVQVERIERAGAVQPHFQTLPIQRHQAPIPTPLDVVAGDFDGDGRLDLFWNSRAERNLGYLARGMVGGRFDLREPFEIGPAVPPYGWEHYELHVGDFNGDGLDDLLWNGRRSNNHHVTALSRGDGTFAVGDLQSEVERYELQPFWEPTSLLVGDIDGDGADDLVWWERRFPITWPALSRGDGTFEPVARIGPMAAETASQADVGDGVDHAFVARTGVGGTPRLVWGQFEGDNVVRSAVWDAATRDWGDMTDQLHWAGYPTTYLFLGAWHFYHMLMADIDGDGADDILWADPATPYPPADVMNRVYTALYREGEYVFDGTRQDWLTAEDPGPFEVRTGDIDGDGRADLVWNRLATTGENRAYVSFSDGTPVLRPDSLAYLHPAGGDWSNARWFVGDVDGDGRADLVWNRLGALNRVHVALSIAGPGDG